MPLRYDEIGEILKVIDGSSCDEVVLETADLKLVVRRRAGDGADPAARAPSSPAPGAAAPARPAAAPASPGAAAPAATAAEPEAGTYVVRAPMVGTFYRAPSPDAPPFVEVGSVVRAGDPLGIIEVMKLFTTLYAESGGKVSEIRADNAALVEYGQVLLVIEAD